MLDTEHTVVYQTVLILAYIKFLVYQGKWPGPMKHCREAKCPKGAGNSGVVEVGHTCS